MFFLNDMLDKKLNLPKPGDELPGRAKAITTASRHAVLKRPLKAPAPDGFEVIYLGMGSFWAAERLFWQIPGIWLTVAGYQGGVTPNPTYQETMTGLTGHAEVVKLVFDPAKLSRAELLKTFWEEHDPTQGMRQGNQVGTIYRSAIYTTSDAQMAEAIASRGIYQSALTNAGLERITTEITPALAFYHAEAEHQQYLHKNPNSSSKLRGTGVEYAFDSPGNE